MQFHSFHDFFNMGGYAPYVWGAYSVFVIVIGFALVKAILSERRIKRFFNHDEA